MSFRHWVLAAIPSLPRISVAPEGSPVLGPPTSVGPSRKCQETDRAGLVCRNSRRQKSAVREPAGCRDFTFGTAGVWGLQASPLPRKIPCGNCLDTDRPCVLTQPKSSNGSRQGAKLAKKYHGMGSAPGAPVG